MQKETLASGEKNGCPKMNLAGSFLHPNIAENMQRYTPIRKNTLNLRLMRTCSMSYKMPGQYLTKLILSDRVQSSK